MKVLLVKDVKSLGKAGDVKEVKDGYGKNFLIGKGFAKHATPEILAEHKAEQERLKAAEAAEIASLKEIAQKLDKIEVVITKKVGNNGHLFGAITKEEVANVLKEQHGIEIDKKAITDKMAVKTVGEHDLDLKLGHGIHAKLHVDVQGE
ncbi:50S ribosomal protein L9 [Sulfurimonas autotrophica]|uniref:Large ribosomal subunit protein bL9 n=1 Tax=Sulfurimonas autotrophica (strain ATCC BAA-671 / DSM 16294 / JCM 11897 / OK10) TaxID=563040 RepID=E0URB5_SULAO|nr:50S ribosomal protein L9 [Sulfurimonas autotrophica]ADN08925.1 LSU ribosomal protein L9P [Sulfurimonas autotrophica DSM 16294]